MGDLILLQYAWKLVFAMGKTSSFAISEQNLKSLTFSWLQLLYTQYILHEYGITEEHKSVLQKLSMDLF